MSFALARQIVLASASGLLYPLCFPPFDVGVLAWVAFIPLHLALLSLEGSPLRRAFWLGWLAGLIAFMGTMSWVVTAMHLYGKMPLALSYAALALLAAYLGLFVAGYGVVVAWLRNTVPALTFVIAPFVWVTLELLRTYLFSGLPWALLGYSQYAFLPAIQIADLTGVYGVSFLIVLVNGGLTELIRPSSRMPPARWLAPAAATIGLSVALVYGEIRLASNETRSGEVRVGLVQPNIDQAHKWDRAYARETLDRYIRLTAQAAPGSDLVVWPEAATPFLFEQEQDYQAEIAALTKAHRVPLLLGSPALRHYASGRPYLLNSAYLFSADGRILGRYDKRHLVPFGEYIPLKTFLFFLDKLVEGIGDFEAGTVPTVLALPPNDAADAKAGRPTFGVVICFEVIFPDLVREFVRDGARFMVTITNDAWFGRSSAPYQHFGMVVLRSVENRIAFARAANTGISGLIAPSGRILSMTPIFTEEAVAGSIPLGSGPTLYSLYGDVFAYGCAIITALWLLTMLVRSRREARGKRQ